MLMNAPVTRRGCCGTGVRSRAAGLYLVGGLLLLLLLPGRAPAQAFRCVDAVTGQAVYTDQPCRGGELVVPKRSAEEERADTDRAQDARERQLQRQETVLQLQQDRLQREQDRLARAQARQAAADAACREARAAATAAADSAASAEQLRTARANAALACGQPPPQEETRIVHGVVPVWGLRPPPPAWRPGPPRGKRRPPHYRGRRMLPPSPSRF